MPPPPPSYLEIFPDRPCLLEEVQSNSDDTDQPAAAHSISPLSEARTSENTGLMFL